jgi:SAM-dependent methyltransferase
MSTRSKEWFELWQEHSKKQMEQARRDAEEELREGAADWVDSSTIVRDALRDCRAMRDAAVPYVLDVGCGMRPTHSGWRMPDGRPVVTVGVDPMAGAYNQALQALAPHYPALLAARRYIAPIAAEEMNACFPPACFDAVWCEDAVVHFIDPSRALEQMLRAVKPGGIVVVSWDVTDESLWRGDFGLEALAFESPIGKQELKDVRGVAFEWDTHGNVRWLRLKKPEPSGIVRPVGVRL